ncbi:MAG: hypothetical protein JJU00_14995 [Opitutales bacterium]|nr:hypothetical protein [Opitutales bacterium]
MSEKFIPSKESVIRAAAELPDADKIKTETHEVALDKKRNITFRRIKMKDSSGKGYRWIYDGKMVVS